MQEEEECIHGLAPQTCVPCLKRARSAMRAMRLRTARSGRPMEFVLKWSPEPDFDICDRQRTVAGTMGSTWWGCWSRNVSRRAGRDRLTTLEAQLDSGTPTRAFIYRMGPAAEVWQARVLSLAEAESSIDQTRRPRGVSFDGCFLFVELADFDAVEPRWPEHHLSLWDKPEAGTLRWASLHSHTSPMYVFEHP